MILLVETEMVDQPHWGWENPKTIGTAVGNIGQWPKGWTGNLEEWSIIIGYRRFN